MKKLSAIFILFILSLNTISSLKLFSIDMLLPTKGLHNKLMDLLVEVQNKDSPRTADDISNAILGLLKELQQNQKRHEEISIKMLGNCKVEEAFRTKEISNSQSSRAAASAHLVKCKKSLESAQTNLPSLKKAQKEFEQSLATKTAERNKQHALYVQRRNDWQEAIQFLREFATQIKNAKTLSFADMGEKLLRHVAKLGRMADAVEVFVALAQAPGKDELAAGPGAASNYGFKSQAKTINNLKAHLNKLINTLVTDSALNDQNEAKANKAFLAVKLSLETLIEKLRVDVQRTEAQIVRMNACVKKEEVIYNSANNKFNRNSKLKSLAGQTCTDFTKEFILATKNRLSEMDVINQILVIMKKRFGQLPEDLVNYLKETRLSFRIYVNSTKFKKYENYVQKHIADNSAGKNLSS